MAPLSRPPLTTVVDAAAFPPAVAPIQTDDTGTTIVAMGRGVLAVQLEPVAGQVLTLVVCHLKSKLLAYPAAGGGTRFNPHDEGERARYAGYALYRRAAEAVTVRATVDQLLHGHGEQNRLILVGDLNDEPQAATTQILYGPPGSQFGTTGFDRPDQGDHHRLWNLAPLIPVAERFTRVYQGQPELIDHILVSNSVVGRVREVHTVADRPLPSIGDDPYVRASAPASDHGAVLAHIDL